MLKAQDNKLIIEIRCGRHSAGETANTLTSSLLEVMAAAIDQDAEGNKHAVIFLLHALKDFLPDDRVLDHGFTTPPPKAA